MRSPVPDEVLRLKDLWEVGIDCLANAAEGRPLEGDDRSVAPCLLCRSIIGVVRKCKLCLLEFHDECGKAASRAVRLGLGSVVDTAFDVFSESVLVRYPQRLRLENWGQSMCALCVGLRHDVGL